MATFKPENIAYATPVPATLSHFASTPWCAKLMADPQLRPIRTPTREPKDPSSEDSLLAHTLATPETIRAWQSYYRPPTASNPAAAATAAGEICSLLYFGSGLDGHPRVAHGGILSALIDEAMAMVAYAHLPTGKHVYTAFIKVGFRRPVETPGALLLRSWIDERSGGRKMWLRANVEDGEGRVCAEGEGLFVVIDGKLKAKL
jgi:thioesterase superfamily protein 4